LETSTNSNACKYTISIIIPTFLEEKLLGNLLAQFNSNLKSKYALEIIVSDGGSNDKTIPIATQFADRVVMHQLDTPQNISQGRNNGASVATGNVLAFLNADCMPADINVFLQSIYDWANDETDNRTDAIACKVRAFPDEERAKDRLFYFLHNDYVRLLNAIGVGMGRGECQIVRRNVFQNVAGYNPMLVAGEDFDLYRRIVKSGGKIKFARNIIIYESPRRFRKYGYLRTLWYWTINSITVILWNKSTSKVWEAVR
jgi:glycosyltransferase involved in cell wall biosynthesis